MTVTRISPVSSVTAALKARTLQEFISHSKDVTGGNLGFPRQVADLEYTSPQQIWCMADTAARKYMAAGLSASERQVIGLRNLSTLDLVIAFVAVARLGHAVLLLSPHLEAAKISYLMDKAGSSLVIDGTDDRDALAALGKTVIPLETVESLGGKPLGRPAGGSEDCVMAPELWSQLSETDAAIIMHSSGSTGPPKLIPKTHLELMTRLRAIPAFCHDKSYFMGSWLYFPVGVFGMLFGLVKPGGPTCWANEKLPLGPEAYRDVLVEMRPQMAWYNPSNLIHSMATPEGLGILKQCIMVSTTGQVMPERLANRLVKEGVHLSNEYGMSELAFALSSGGRRPGDPEWEYMSANPECAPHLWFRPLEPSEGNTWGVSDSQVYELVVLPSHPTQDKRYANSPDGSFRTQDVFVRHPNGEERYKCIGRMSDDIKIAPQSDSVGMRALDYEHKVQAGNEDILQEAVLFGNDRQRAGVFLFTRPGCTLSSEEVVERVWATVQREINGVMAEGLDKDMLIVVRDAVVPRTPKGNFVRHEVYLKFENEMNEAYGVV
ncbi:acetyl-CoA synthetase-like protein [Chaetomidium leptoderma]|uniref:Acetyl-CoA synthetase-like protein n=1 Tax=Chaetomidium leptoderma TaxID=669021 RepID=A0AAN6VM64_9PEZI|nr:acetyl-CoA synthetase-like protein [Chaetomidium leptoderma]